MTYHQPFISALQELSTAKPGLGFWKLHRQLRRRLIRVLERLKEERGLPHMLRTDNGPEFLRGIHRLV